MKEKFNPDNDSLDLADECFKKTNFEEDIEEYFPVEESIPPHY